MWRNRPMSKSGQMWADDDDNDRPVATLTTQITHVSSVYRPSERLCLYYNYKRIRRVVNPRVEGRLSLFLGIVY